MVGTRVYDLGKLLRLCEGYISLTYDNVPPNCIQSRIDMLKESIGPTIVDKSKH